MSWVQVRKFGFGDEMFDEEFEMIKDESGAENRNGESKRIRLPVSRLTNNKPLVC